MPLARAFSVALIGLDGHVVEVEADLAQGLPGLTVIGLPDAALAEARDRIRAAVVNSGEAWPSRRITLALSPAALPKRGSGFDLGGHVLFVHRAIVGTGPAASGAGAHRFEPAAIREKAHTGRSAKTFAEPSLNLH